MNTKNTGLIAIALVVILGVSVMFVASKDKEQTKPIITPTTVNRTPSPSQIQYKDGVYSTEGNYTSPAGAEKIDVILTLKNDVVTEATVTPKAENPKSVYMQEVFVENFKPLVVGRNIKDLKLDKVAGSSLTPRGFNDAIEKIKMEAKS